MTHSHCFVCGSEASIETVKGEGGERFDVLCSGHCPRYIISRLAIRYLPEHPIHRAQAAEGIKRTAAESKMPLLNMGKTSRDFLCWSVEDEALETN